MNKENLVSNICAIALLTMSLVETIVIGILCAIKWYVLVLWQFAAIVGVLLVRYAYQVAQVRNASYTQFYRRDTDGFDDEPSGWAIGIVKLAGYLILFGFALFYPISQL